MDTQCFADISNFEFSPTITIYNVQSENFKLTCAEKDFQGFG
jgi:hypothetical protein